MSDTLLHDVPTVNKRIVTVCNRTPVTIDERIDEVGTGYVKACQAAGHAGIVIRTMPDGSIRLILPQLPDDACARMLESSAQIIRANNLPESTRH